MTHINTYTSLSSYSPWPGKTYGRMVELTASSSAPIKLATGMAATGEGEGALLSPRGCCSPSKATLERDHPESRRLARRQLANCMSLVLEPLHFKMARPGWGSM